MQKIIIDPSIAVVLDIKPLGKSERRPIIFTADEPWPGDYELKVWNSDKKNTSFEIPAADLEVDGNVITWWIDATAQSLVPRTYYAEIFSSEFKSIIYKANFEILN